MLLRTLATLLVLGGTLAPAARADLAWTGTQTVSTKLTNGGHPTVGVDSDGGAVVAWEETKNGKDRIHVATRTRRGFLGPSQILSPASVNASGPRVVIARDGTAVLAWTQDRPGSDPNGIVTAIRRPGQASFDTPVMETTNPNDESLRNLAMDGNGRSVLLSSATTARRA